MTDSILSHEERAVASLLASGTPPEEIAAERNVSQETVERTIDRIREKTDRAFATLTESPFTAELAAELSEETRIELLDALDG